MITIMYPPPELRGTWTRTATAIDGSEPFSDQAAYWIQLARTFVDVRVAPGAMAFGGTTTVLDDRIIWQHEQRVGWPDGLDSDEARFALAGDELVEHGSIGTGATAVPYTEWWRRTTRPDAGASARAACGILAVNRDSCAVVVSDANVAAGWVLRTNGGEWFPVAATDPSLPPPKPDLSGRTVSCPHGLDWSPISEEQP